METLEVIGIDVSKLTLDCCIHSYGMQEKFKNDFEGIDQLSEWSIKNSGCAKENCLYSNILDSIVQIDKKVE